MRQRGAVLGHVGDLIALDARKLNFPIRFAALNHMPEGGRIWLR